MHAAVDTVLSSVETIDCSTKLIVVYWTTPKSIVVLVVREVVDCVLDLLRMRSTIK